MILIAFVFVWSDNWNCSCRQFLNQHYIKTAWVRRYIWPNQFYGAENQNLKIARDRGKANQGCGSCTQWVIERVLFHVAFSFPLPSAKSLLLSTEGLLENINSGIVLKTLILQIPDLLWSSQSLKQAHYLLSRLSDNIKEALHYNSMGKSQMFSALQSVKEYAF